MATVLCVLAAGCVSGIHVDGWEDDATDPQVETRTVESQVRMTAGDSQVFVNGRALGVIGGQARVVSRADGQLVLEELELILRDQSLNPAEVPPLGIELRALSARLMRPVSAPADVTGDLAFARVKADFELSWSYLTKSGAPSPLAPQRFERLLVDVTMQGGGARVSVSARQDGEVWRLNELSMRDLVLDLALTRDEAQRAPVIPGTKADAARSGTR